jgi:hypothetical protein
MVERMLRNALALGEAIEAIENRPKRRHSTTRT